MDPIERLKKLEQEREKTIDKALNSPRKPRRKRQPRLTFERLLERDKNKTIEVRTGLSKPQFEHILGLLETRGEGMKRGRKLLDIKLRLTILLEWLRHGETYDELSFSFGLSNSRIQTSITSIWDPLEEVLMRDVIPSKPLEYESKRKFTYHPGAVGALDATLVSIWKPRNTEEDHLYYSGKHHKHGVKVQVLVAPDGHPIHYGGIVPGSVHDFTLYQQSGLAADMTFSSNSRSGSHVSLRPQILADGGYQGIHLTYPEAVIPVRKPRGRMLSQAERETNRIIGCDRCIVECFFSRMKRSWAIFQRPYRSDRGSVETLVKICICLTGIKIRDSPLIRDVDAFDPDSSSEEEELSDSTPDNPILPVKTSPIKVKRSTVTRGKKGENLQETNDSGDDFNLNSNQQENSSDDLRRTPSKLSKTPSKK